MTKVSHYRWVILSLICFILLWSDMALVIAGPLAHALIPDVKLTLPQFVSLTTFGLLGGGIIAMVGGVVGDRIGIKKVISIGAIMMGICWTLRALGIGYAFLLVCTFLGGAAGIGLTLSNLPKLMAIWFKRDDIGLATGIYGTSVWIGMAMGLGLAVPWFGSNWSLAYLVTGLTIVICGILWLIFGKDTPSGKRLPQVQISVISAIKKVVRIRNLWVAGFMLMFAMSTIGTIASLIPTSLASVHGISPSVAGFAVSLAMIGMVIGSYLVPMLSDKFGLRKPFLTGAGVFWGVCILFAWLLAPNPGMWFLLFFAGFGVGAAFAGCLVLPIEAPGMRSDFIAIGSALVVTIGYITTGFLPTYGVAAIAAVSVTWAYVALLVFGLAYAVIAQIGLIESGSKVKREI